MFDFLRDGNFFGNWIIEFEMLLDLLVDLDTDHDEWNVRNLTKGVFMKKL